MSGQSALPHVVHLLALPASSACCLRLRPALQPIQHRRQLLRVQQLRHLHLGRLQLLQHVALSWRRPGLARQPRWPPPPAHQLPVGAACAAHRRGPRRTFVALLRQCIQRSRLQQKVLQVWQQRRQAGQRAQHAPHGAVPPNQRQLAAAWRQARQGQLHKHVPVQRELAHAAAGGGEGAHGACSGKQVKYAGRIRVRSKRKSRQKATLHLSVACS